MDEMSLISMNDAVFIDGLRKAASENQHVYELLRVIGLYQATGGVMDENHNKTMILASTAFSFAAIDSEDKKDDWV